jgi:hypothetical protein
MGIRFSCPNGHKLHVKEFLAGRRALCPTCGVRLVIPVASGEAAAPVSASGELLGPVLETPSVAIPVLEAAAPLGGDVPPPSALPAAAASDLSASPVSPVLDSFTRQRRMKRQKQTKLAVILLLTVIALAIVLAFVLSWNNGDTEPAAPAQTVSTAAEPDFTII